MELSNHPGAMLREERQRRELAVAAANKALEQHRARLAEVRSRRDQALAGRQWWTWLRCVLRLWHELQNVPSALPAPGEVVDRHEILRAGMAGEQKAQEELGRVFGDGWVLLRGYRNQAGEIDQLILGRRGLIAVEVKHLNATVHCDGDDWRADKYDRYGNLVDQHPIADRGGRSPCRQLNEPSDLLEELLSSRGHPVPVQRVVLLTHPRSRLGHLRNSAVHVTTSAQDIGQLARNSPVSLAPAQVEGIVRLIVSDHRRGEARRRPQH